MMNELREFMEAGAVELERDAAESVDYVPRGTAGGEARRVLAVVGPAPVEYQLEGPGGAVIAVTAAAVLRKAALPEGSVPRVGDRLRACDGTEYEVVRVNGSAVSATWSLDLTMAARGNPPRR